MEFTLIVEPQRVELLIKEKDAGYEKTSIENLWNASDTGFSGKILPTGIS